MDDIFPHKQHRRAQIDLNVVPILDMLVCVIFFLLLTTTFVGYSKLTLPPAGVAVVTEPLAPIPLNPKLLVVNKDGKLQISLLWEGNSPGSKTIKLSPKEERVHILETTQELINDFVTEKKANKTIQIGLGENISYQTLVTIMDAVREKMPDQVLIGFEEAKILTDKLIE